MLTLRGSFWKISKREGRSNAKIFEVRFKVAFHGFSLGISLDITGKRDHEIHLLSRELY